MKKEEEEEEGERRIKPRHSLLHAVAGEGNKRQQRRGGGHMHTLTKHLYIHSNTLCIHTYKYTHAEIRFEMNAEHTDRLDREGRQQVT